MELRLDKVLSGCTLQVELFLFVRIQLVLILIISSGAMNDKKCLNNSSFHFWGFVINLPRLGEISSWGIL